MNLPIRSLIAVVTVSEFEKEKNSWKVLHHGKATFSLNTLSRQIHLITKSTAGTVSTWNFVNPFTMQGPSSFVMEARVIQESAKPETKPIVGVHFGTTNAFKEFAVFLNPKNDPKLQSRFFINLEKFNVFEKIQSPKKHPDACEQAQSSSPTTLSQQAPLVAKTKSHQSTSLPSRANETSDIHDGGYTNSMKMIAQEAKSNDMTRIRITRPDTNESYELDVFQDSSILGVKVEIWNQSHIMPEKQTLVFAGKVLDDDETIHRLQIKSDERILLYPLPPPQDHSPPPSHRQHPISSRESLGGFAGGPEMSNDRGYPSPLSFRKSTPTVYDSQNVLSVYETTSGSPKTSNTTNFPNWQPSAIDNVSQEMQDMNPSYPQLSLVTSSPITSPKKPKSTQSKQRPITNWFSRTSRSPSGTGSQRRARSRSYSRSRSRSRSRDGGRSAARSSSRSRERKRDQPSRRSATKQTTLLSYQKEIDDAFATPSPQPRRQQNGPSEALKGRVLDSLDNSFKTVRRSVDAAHGGISSVDSGIDLLKKTLDL